MAPRHEPAHLVAGAPPPAACGMGRCCTASPPGCRTARTPRAPAAASQWWRRWVTARAGAHEAPSGAKAGRAGPPQGGAAGCNLRRSFLPLVRLIVGGGPAGVPRARPILLPDGCAGLGGRGHAGLRSRRVLWGGRGQLQGSCMGHVDAVPAGRGHVCLLPTLMLSGTLTHAGMLPGCPQRCAPGG